MAYNYGKWAFSGGWQGWYRNEANRKKRAAKRLLHKRRRSNVFAFKQVYR